MVSGNKGDWSELYAFLKMVSDKELSVAGPNLEKTDISYPIVRILRGEKGSVKIYDLKDDNNIQLEDGESKKIINISDLKEGVKKIFDTIKASEDTTFSIEPAAVWMEKLNCDQIKAGSGRKSDIDVVIHDFKVGRDTEVGFSIKSNIGGAPTLLNASSQTNLVFKVSNFKGEIEDVNQIDEHSKITKRIKAIEDDGGEFNFHSIDSNTFERNLRRIDSFLPEIIARYVYHKFSGNGRNIEELTLATVNNDSIKLGKYEFDQDDLEYKIKGLLQASALGMQPGSLWNGEMETSGGYIVVREDGEMVCYHLYNIDAFREYLYKNTKIETPSSSRHGFGNLYKEGGELFFKLNLQIRFSD